MEAGRWKVFSNFSRSRAVVAMFSYTAPSSPLLAVPNVTAISPINGQCTILRIADLLYSV